jgi:DNA polymerase III sliding clamp (beta) subunit (PCNA family)
MFNPTCIFTRAELADALKCAAHLIKSKMPQPWLGCVKLSVCEGGLLLEATDLIRYLSYEIQNVDVTNWQDVLLPHDQLESICRELSDDMITIMLEGEYGKVKAKGASFDLWTQPVEKFEAGIPSIDPSTASVITVRSNDLKRAIDQTVFCTGPTDTARNWAFEAVMFNARSAEKTLHIAGLDGRRGGLVIIPLAQAVDTSCLVNPSLLKIVADFPDDSDVMITFSANLVEMKCDFLTIRSTQLAGGYPDHMVVFGGTGEGLIKVDREAFRQRLRQALLVLQDDDDHRPEIKFVAEKKQIVMRGKSIRGDGTVKLDAIEQQGEKLEITFNARWMADGVSAMTGKNIDISVIVKNGVPVLIRVGDGEGYKYSVAAISEPEGVKEVSVKSEPEPEPAVS